MYGEVIYFYPKMCDGCSNQMVVWDIFYLNIQYFTYK